MDKGLKERWEATCADVARIARQAERDPGDIKVIAVSKTVGPEVVADAIEAGALDFGENRAKPFTEKCALYPQARWHFIGRLQSNKAKLVVGRACLIHSLDRPSLLHAIEREAEKQDIVQNVLVEVSVSGEESKGGIALSDLPAFFEDIDRCPHVFCKGLMTMAPQGDLDVARKVFSDLADIAEKSRHEYCSRDSIALDELSMGMSQDYACAIEQGATMVRIGRRIFSEDFDPKG